MKEGSLYEVACPTTDVQLIEAHVSISDKLAVKLAGKLLRSYRVSLTVVEFLVRTFFIQRFTVDYTTNAGNASGVKYS